MSQRNSVTIQAPATTANCGSGFDTLSIALNLYNYITLTEVDGDKGTFKAPDDQQPLTPGSINLIQKAINLFSSYTQHPVNCIEINTKTSIPLTRGLGSSACIRGGILAGLNTLYRTGLDAETLIRMTAQLEDSADNPTALFKGGFCVTRVDPDTHMYVHSFRFSIDESLGCALLCPDLKVNTPHARSILPKTLPFDDVVKTMNSLAYLVAIMASKKYDYLRDAVKDLVHEPFRKTLTPFVDETIEAGIEVGAYTGWISGSGSTLLCICPQELTDTVCQAMSRIYTEKNLGHQTFALQPDNHGLRVL